MATIRRALAALVVTSLALLGLTACGQQSDPAEGSGVVVKHAQGETTVPRDPQRIVVLDMGSLDTLNALGLGDRVVGLPKSNVPTFLSAFNDEKFADVGTLKEPNYEAINKARPDLVIVGYRSAKTYPEMSKHFPTIDVTPAADATFLDTMTKPAEIIGQATGRSAQVAERVGALKKRVDELSGKGASLGTGMILMTSGGKVTLHGPGSRYGMIHSVLGVQQAVTEIKEDSHGMPISFELIAEKNPGALFVVDRDAAIGEKGANAQQILDNAVMRKTKAWTTKQVTYLDGQRWYVTIHGLDNANAMLDEVSSGLKKA